RRRATQAAPDNRIKRIAAAGRRPIEAADIAPIPGLHEMLRDQAEVPGIVEQAPAPDRTRRHATVRECHDQRSARLQHAPGFADNLAWARQMLNRYADRCTVELGGGE